ncbi:MAG TPA: phosphotransferase [Thermoleophilaceae bacterium]|jgi:thiamine kinase-like enzyme
MCPRTSESIADLVRPLIGEPLGEPEPLTGGITNHNFRVRTAEGEFAVRVFGKGTSALGIDRDAERAATEAAAHAGVGPELVAFSDELLVTRFIHGEPMPEIRIHETSAALRAVHAGPGLPTAFSGIAVGEDYAARASELPPDYPGAHAVAKEIEAALQGPEHDPVPCHNDLLNANLIWDGERVRIVDWDYAGMGDRYFDLGNLSINNGLSEEDDERLLAAYFGEPCTPARFASLRLMRIVSDFREAMWGVLQSSISELDFDFHDYSRTHFARMRESAADRRYPGWLEDAAGG